MSRFIRASEARDQIEAIIADVVDSGEPVLLGRNDEPEVVLLPYTAEDAVLDMEFDVMLNQAHEHFKSWLVERGYNPETLSEEDVERIIREA